MLPDKGKKMEPYHFFTLRKIAWASAGLFWFIWLGYEDRDLTPILILSAGIAFPIGIEINHRRGMKGIRKLTGWIIYGAVIGGLSGALVGPIAVVLVALKISLHQHGIPDFDNADLIVLIKRIPAWSLAGLLFGISAATLGWLNVNSTPVSSLD